jgi:hypothetical protein
MHRFLLWSVVCAFIGMTALQAFADDAVALRYKFAKGQFIRYEFSNECRISGEGMSRSIVLNGVIRLRVVNVLPDGGAEVRLAVESCSSKESGVSKKINPNDVLPMVLMVSPDGVVKDRIRALQQRDNKNVAGDAQFSASEADLLEAGLCVLSVPLPSGNVKAGDTWKRTVEAEKAGDKVVEECELIGATAQRGGRTVASIVGRADRSDSKTDSNSNTVAQGNIHSENKASFDIDSGWPVDVLESDSGEYAGTATGEASPLHVTIKMAIHASLLPPTSVNR